MNIITRTFLKQRIHEMVSPSEELLRASEEGRPIVLIDAFPLLTRVAEPDATTALESACEVVRENAAVPALAGVLHGHIRLGLTVDDLVKLARTKGTVTASRSQLPLVISAGSSAIPDGSLLMVIGELAGIRTVATTTADGVPHMQVRRRARGQNRQGTPFSHELSRTTVTVVCSGSSAIDDPRESLGVFESYGTPVMGFRTEGLPHHFVHDTGIPVPNRVHSVQECADAMQYMWRLGFSGGMVVMNPISEAFAIPHEELLQWLTSAVIPVEPGRRGRVPLLDTLSDSNWLDLAEKSGGRSVAAERELIRANSALAARIAVAFTV
ncbi:MAG: pseudouridine-5'-phosphate glycosidase [Spirochaetaceae bacterium]